MKPFLLRFVPLLAIAVLFPQFARAADITNLLSGTILYDATSPIIDWRGTNTAVNGTVTWSPETRTMSADVWVELDKWDSHYPLRDTHTKAMFEVEQFPKAHFVVTGMSGDAGSGDVQLKGTLEMHGTKRDIELPGKLQVANGLISFEGATSLRITDYGMNRPSLLGARVADEVKITVKAEGKRE